LLGAFGNAAKNAASSTVIFCKGLLKYLFEAAAIPYVPDPK